MVRAIVIHFTIGKTYNKNHSTVIIKFDVILYNFKKQRESKKVIFLSCKFQHLGWRRQLFTANNLACQTLLCIFFIIFLYQPKTLYFLRVCGVKYFSKQYDFLLFLENNLHKKTALKYN